MVFYGEGKFTRYLILREKFIFFLFIYVIHDFWYLGKGDVGNKISKCYTFDLFTLSINIH